MQRRKRNRGCLQLRGATKDSPAKDVVALYRLRMQIEEAFRDLKSSRFGLGLERQLTYQVQRLQVLLLIATLALLVAWILGVAVEQTGQHRQYQPNSIKHRVVLSTIFLGLREREKGSKPLDSSPPTQGSPRVVHSYRASY